MSKYSGIKFPFFGLRKIPLDIKYTRDTIYVFLKDRWVLLDDRSKLPDPPLYFNRLMCLDLQGIDRVMFDFTCIRMEQLLKSQIKWGIDALGTVFDLSKKEKFLLKCTRVKKVKNNLMWVKGITYPFVLKYQLSKSLNKFLFVELVQIDLTWYLHRFTYKYNFKKHLYI